ncbi:hypothetical protein F4678DRAFT_424021 [Xylaria arbuscula]|nr:hypothetical protein F4678DRAFT_424021 [Xylaria arbuscula]
MRRAIGALSIVGGARSIVELIGILNTLSSAFRWSRETLHSMETSCHHTQDMARIMVFDRRSNSPADTCSSISVYMLLRMILTNTHAIQVCSKEPSSATG